MYGLTFWAVCRAVISASNDKDGFEEGKSKKWGTIPHEECIGGVSKALSP